MRRQLAAALTVAVLGVPMDAFGQDCLHGPNETPGQRARRVEALGAARHINTLQAGRPHRESVLDLAQLSKVQAEQAATRPAAKSYNFAPDGEVTPGWQLTLSRTETGYWFMIRDKTDPCGFAFVSNEAGVIYRAEPIR